jgi:hypothetical protein
VQKKYERKELLNRYIVENKNKFSSNSFYLLVLRNFELSCTASEFGYSKDLALSYTLNKVKKGSKIYVLTDNKLSILKLSARYSNYRNFYFIYEDQIIMDRFGFYYSPYLYQIKNYTLYDWNNIDKYCKLHDVK